MKSIVTTIERHVLKIVLSRPEIHNAFDPLMISELTQAFRSVDKEESVRAVLITAEGKSFCAGADLNWMKSMVNFSKEENRSDSLKLFDMFDAARLCPVPVIASVFGSVMAGGLGLVATADIVAATKETRFCFSEVRLGLVPATISAFVTLKTSSSLARTAMLTGEIFEAAQAREMGLVEFCGEKEEVDDFVQSKIENIVNNGPQASRETKKLLNSIATSGWPQIRDETARVIAERRVSAEGQDGLASFFEKRKPKWKLN